MYYLVDTIDPQLKNGTTTMKNVMKFLKIK